jgi:hypothetical protein
MTKQELIELFNKVDGEVKVLIDEIIGTQDPEVQTAARAAVTSISTLNSLLVNRLLDTPAN